MKSIQDAINEAKGIKSKTSSNIVPFGKYKGQPLEILASDPDYCTYLTKDNWLQEHHPKIYQTVIVNNFQESSETPEHNSLQVLFLEDEFCKKLIEIVNPDYKSYHFEKIKDMRLNLIKKDKKEIEIIEEIVLEKELELNILNNNTEELYYQLILKKNLEDINSRWEFKDETINKRIGIAEAWSKNAKSEFKFKKNSRPSEISGLKNQIENLVRKLPLIIEDKDIIFNIGLGRTFEFKGIDIILTAYFDSQEYNMEIEGPFYIEIKPQVGDDYPAVLRQMRANGSNILFLKSYTGTGATLAQFIKTFELSDIKVIFLDEVK